VDRGRGWGSTRRTSLAARKGGWTEQEDAILLEQHAKFYNKWAEIAKHLSGRNDNDVKNRWYQAHSSDAKEPPNYTRTAAQQFASYDMAEFQGDVLRCREAAAATRGRRKW
jgi:hypothetical protein